MKIEAHIQSAGGCHDREIEALIDRTSLAMMAILVNAIACR
jgi:hypothetical protein